LTLTTQIVTTRSEFEGLEPEWLRLFERCTEAAPFVSPDWLMPWWTIFGSTSDPFVVTARRGGRLVGLLPTRTYAGRVYFIGHGLTDRLDVLAEDLEVAAALWRRLADTGIAGELAEIPAASPLRALAPRVQPLSVCPVVDLTRWKMHPKLRSNNGRSKRRLQASASLTWDIAPVGQAEEYIDAWIALHTRRWQVTAEPGMLQTPEIQDFHRASGRRLAQAGWAEFHGLRVDGRLAGVLYALQRHGTTYFYLSGYDPDLSPFSPGSLLVEQAFAAALARSDRKFDFLRGAEPYKFSWGAESVQQFVAFLT
jgi:CelD/BcsL family acetyltransferase involved in cellulose biosynthesis